jgi:hypothetical protein
MDAEILKNSYVIFLISFILLCIIVYFFGIGQEVIVAPTANDNVEKTVESKFNWKYPLAISLVIWAFWHFYLYPVDDEFSNLLHNDHVPKQIGGFGPHRQRINMVNWN